MAFYAREQIEKLKKLDLFTYLSLYEPDELIHLSGETYTTRTHDSLKISNGMWMWWSRKEGGKSALDYLIKVQGMTFIEAADRISAVSNGASIVERSPIKVVEKQLVLPKKATDNEPAIAYLKRRGIEPSIIKHCIDNGSIYESIPRNNIVFVGFDESGVSRYAGLRGTGNIRYLGDVAGSDKHFSFRIVDEHRENENVHVFEGAIDLLSYATLLQMNDEEWKCCNLIALAGVYQAPKNDEDCKTPVALERFLGRNPQINSIVLHLDNDRAGRIATKALMTALSPNYTVTDVPPRVGKDMNDYLMYVINRQHMPRGRSYER